MSIDDHIIANKGLLAYHAIGIGGGPTVGLTVVAATPAVIAAMAIQTIQHDDESFSMLEHKAPTSSLGSTVFATAAWVEAVVAVSVLGLNGSGISTGLATLPGGSIPLAITTTLRCLVVLTFSLAFLLYTLGHASGTGTGLPWTFEGK